VPTDEIIEIDKEQIIQILAPDGPLSKFLKGFESREQQVKMMSDIIDAYNNRHIALIEAGTGTGKSLAYLIPAILWHQIHKERTVISTNTINLQEQLLNKDIPLLTRALNIECKAVLVKGMGNYLCMRKLDEVKLELALMSRQEKEELEQIEAWASTTRDGSRSSLPIVPSGGTWERVGAEYDTCNRKECPHFEECFYFKARRNSHDANILIVNHHLLCSDLISRMESEDEESGLLPSYNRVILDEAHNFEEVATDFFASRLSQNGLMRTLYRLSSERQSKAIGKLPVLKAQIQECYRKGDPKDVTTLLNRLTIDLPALRWDVYHCAEQACEAFQQFARILSTSSKDDEIAPGEIKLRIQPHHQTHPLWIKEVAEAAKRLLDIIEKFVQSLDALSVDVGQVKNDKLREATKGTLFDIKALGGRLMEAATVLHDFIDPVIPIDKVRWIELQTQRSAPNTCLMDANLDVSKDLAHYLFKRFHTTVLVSATLTTNQKFDFIRRRLGLVPALLDERVVTENIYDSPFDYPNQALLVVPTNLPLPTQPEFTKAAVEAIWMAIQASRGNAFVLFTSYQMLKACFEALNERLQKHRYHPLKQGDTNRQSLINKFKTTDRSVLFGTDSFWEGVDVAGDALRCVIIVKLPFKVPSEPIIQARCESINEKGGDAFRDYSLPTAIVKFKQGFGRLIRNKRDRGCIVCLDGRLHAKGYGKQFLNSLPPCRQLFAPMEEAQAQMEEFYRRTYHFLCNK